jgi:hypothetical protein
MNRRRDRSSVARLDHREPSTYALPDPELRAYDHGVGVLTIAGEVRGYLASVVWRMTFPPRALWPWFVVVWPDGKKERVFEDYGPGWWTVRELDAGFFDHHGPSSWNEKRFLGLRLRSSMPGPPLLFDFGRLSADEAARKWRELGLTDADF